MQYDDDDVIRVLIDYNPKLEGSGCWHVSNYNRDGMTVGEFRHKVRGGRYRPDSANADLKWNIERRYIRIESARSSGIRTVIRGVVDSVQAPQAKTAGHEGARGRLPEFISEAKPAE